MYFLNYNYSRKNLKNVRPQNGKTIILNFRQIWYNRSPPTRSASVGVFLTRVLTETHITVIMSMNITARVETHLWNESFIISRRHHRRAWAKGIEIQADQDNIKFKLNLKKTNLIRPIKLNIVWGSSFQKFSTNTRKTQKESEPVSTSKRKT